MEDQRPTNTFHRTPSGTYNLTQYRSPSQSQSSTPWQGQSSPGEDYGWPTPPGQPSGSSFRRKPVSSTGQYTQLSLNDENYISNNRPQHISNQSFASSQSEVPSSALPTPQSEDALLGNPRDSGRLQLLPPLPSPYHPVSVSLPPSQWRWLRQSWIMYFFLIIGITGAISHHVYYTRLNGQPAKNQNNMLRYGTALAYVTKASLVAAIIFGFKQQIWATFRRKNLQMGTIDSLFAAVDDPSALLNLEMAKMAKAAMALAMLVWLFPLIVIITPATLTVASLAESVNASCPSVRTLNFDLEKTRNWRDGHKINGLFELSMMLWNCTLPSSSTVYDPYNETFFDYYSAPSPGIEQVVTLSVHLKKVIEMENATALVCGRGWNCTYTVSFTAPGYKCDELAKGVGDNVDGLQKMDAPFNTSLLIPEGDLSYVAHTSRGEYSPVQIDTTPGGVPTSPFPWSPHLGAFRTEPVLWIGYTEINKPNVPLPTSNTDPGWSSAFTPRIMKCEHYVTNYTVQFRQSLAGQTTTVTNRTYIRRLIETEYVPGVDANDGTKDNITASPESNYILPLDVENYRFTAAYHALGQLMRKFINGTITNNPTTTPMQATDAVLTRLVNPRNFFVVDDFMHQLQYFYEDLVLSTFSNPSFYFVSWAGAPNEPSGTLNATEAEKLWPCTKSRVINKFVYRTRDLWLVYGAAIVLAIVGVALGAAAIAQNNHHVRDTRFSSIVAATRAPCLDDLPWKRSRWGEVPPEIYQEKLEYGVISDGLAKDSPLGSPETTSTSTYHGFAPVGKGHQGLGLRGEPRLSALSFKKSESH